MAFNVPVYDTEEFSFGPCVIYLKAFPGTTDIPPEPTTADDVGAVRSGANYDVSRTLVDIHQGNPATLVKTYVTEETGVLSLTGLQWNFSNFSKALGVEDVAGSTFDFGGSLNVKEVSIKLVHDTPNNDTYTLILWKARGGERIAFNFTDDPHEFDYSFNSILCNYDYAGTALSSGAQLFRLIKS